MLLLVSGSTVSVGKLAGLWPDRLGHLVTPNNRNGMASLVKTGLSWAADNGAFKGFEPDSFRRFLAKVAGHPRCLFVACPDALCDPMTTAERFDEWAPRIEGLQPVAFVGQDGQEDLPLPWDRFDAYFIGGSTRWKLSRSSFDLAHEAKSRGKWVHMGRVNSLRRMEVAHEMGCDSLDGSSASMFGDKYIHKYLRWLAALDYEPRRLFGCTAAMGTRVSPSAGSRYGSSGLGSGFVPVGAGSAK